jgi:nucleotide-binding universal stress UspA family protein
MKLIVALIDFSDVTRELITLAGKVARGMNSKLTLLHVAMPEPDFVEGHEREEHSRKELEGDSRNPHRKLEILELELKKLGIDAASKIVHADSLSGNPVRKIVDEVDRLTPDLVVMGSHGHGRLYEMLVGSVTNAVVRKVRRPVLLVPSQGAGAK